MENLVEQPQNFCPKCQQLVTVSGQLSVIQEMYFHISECIPSKKRKSDKRVQRMQDQDETTMEEMNKLITVDDYTREVNVVCGRVVTLKDWQLDAVKHIVEKYTNNMQSFVLADEMGLGKTLTAISVALLLHRSTAVRQRILDSNNSEKRKWTSQGKLLSEQETYSTARSVVALGSPPTAGMPDATRCIANSSGIFLVICPKACIYDAWMRGLEKFTAMGHKVFYYEGSRREERLHNTLETVYRYNVNDLLQGTYQHKAKRLLFIITTSQTASRECLPNRKLNNLKKARSAAKLAKSPRDSTADTQRGPQKEATAVDSLLLSLPYTLVIFDEVHKAKTGPATASSASNEACPTSVRRLFDNKQTCKVGAQMPSQVYTMLHYMTHTKHLRVLGMTGTPIANRMSDIANLSNALNLPVEFHHTETFFSAYMKEAFKREFFLRRIKSEVNIHLPPIVVVDQRVPFTSPLPLTMHDYGTTVENLEKLAPQLSHWLKMANARVPGAYAQLCRVRSKYQACIMTLRTISAAPISWPFSKVAMYLKSIHKMLSDFTSVNFKVCINTMTLSEDTLPTSEAKNTELPISSHVDLTDDIEIYENANDLDEQNRQLDLDEDFIDDEPDGVYSKAIARARKRIASGQAPREDDDEDGDVKWKKRGVGSKEVKCPTLEDIAVEIDKVLGAVKAFEDILEGCGVSILNQLLPSEAQLIAVQGQLLLLNATFTASSPHLLPHHSTERTCFVKQLNTIWSNFLKYDKKLGSSHNQQELMAAVKIEFLNQDPKLQETLRLVKAHMEGRVDSSLQMNGATCCPSPVSSSTADSPPKVQPPAVARTVVVSSCFLRCLYLFRKILAGAGISSGILQGSLSVDQRKVVLQDFEEGRIQVLLLSQNCGAEGITLTSSSRMILTDVGLSPSMADQVIARVHRLGQENEVHVSRLCVASSIEDFLIHELLPQKNKLIQEKFMATEVVDKDDEMEGRTGGTDDSGENEGALDDLLGALQGLEEDIGGKETEAPVVSSIAGGVASYWRSFTSNQGCGGSDHTPKELETLKEEKGKISIDGMDVKGEVERRFDSKPQVEISTVLSTTIAPADVVHATNSKLSRDNVSLSIESNVVLDSLPWTLVKDEGLKEGDSLKQYQKEVNGEVQFGVPYLVSADLQISPRAIVNEKELEVLIGEPYIMSDDERKLLGKTAVTGHRLKKPQPTLVYDLSDDDDDDKSDYHNKLL